MRTGFFVYILTGKSGTLYTGITNNLERRVGQHRAGEGSVFTAKYGLKRLVYFEEYPTAMDAIRREKTIKGWTRRKKLALVSKMNPMFRDLAAVYEGAETFRSRHPERSEGSPTPARNHAQSGGRTTNGIPRVSRDVGSSAPGTRMTVCGRRPFVGLRPPQGDGGLAGRAGI